MRFLSRSLTGVLLLALTAGLLVFAVGLMMAALQERAAREGGGPPRQEQVAAARVLPVRPETVSPALEAFGELQARRELEIRAPVPGRVVAIAPEFQEGGRVEAGQTLLSIDPSGAEAALARARAETAEAEADRLDAERTVALARDEVASARAQAEIQGRALERARSLAGRGVGSDAAIETAEIAAASAEQSVLAARRAEAAAEARIDQAQARIERAAIDLAEAERDLADTEIRAAFDGVLAEVSTLEGGLVGLNERLARLVDPERLEAVFRVSAAQRARLVDEGGALVGAPVTVDLGVSGVEVEARGRVARESADVGEGRTGRTLFAALEPEPALRPGDFVRVLLEEPPLEGVARLPASALAADGTVLALGEGDRLEAVPATLLRRQGDEVLIDAAGLAGREVVAERSPLLGPGVRVRPIRPEEGAGAGAAAPLAPVAAAASPLPGGPLVALTEERRAALRAAVEADPEMPGAAKARLLSDLEREEVPVATVERIEAGAGI